MTAKSSAAWCLICLLLLLLPSAWAQDSTAGSGALVVVDVSAAQQQALSLSPYLEVLEDPTGALTLSNIQSTTYTQLFKAPQTTAEALSFGFTRSAVWFRLTLVNSSQQPQTRLLEVANYALSHVDFYAPAATAASGYQATRTGAAHAFSSRAVKHRFFVFPVAMPANSQQVLYLRVQAVDGLVLPARLWSERAFNDYTKQDYSMQSLYYGMVIAMVLFNLLLFVALRDGMFLLYVGFEVVFALALAAFGGLAHELLWPQAARWSDTAHFVGWSGTGLLLTIFCKNLMRDCLHNTLLNTWLNFIIIALSLSVTGLLLFGETFVLISVGCNVIATITAIGTFIYGMHHRNRPAYFLFTAFTALMIGSLLTVGRALGLLPSNFLTTNGLQIGSALEMVILALALADRFNQIRKEKAADQAALIQKHNEAQLALAENDAQQAKNAALQVQAELARKDTELAQKEADYTREQLQQADKMASLGQLVASVTHEINTPIGAISSSGQSISEALCDVAQQLPPLLQQLDPASSQILVQLLLQTNQPKTAISSREERTLVKKVTETLESANVDQSRQKALIMVQLNAHNDLAIYLPLLQHTHSEAILMAVRNFGSAQNNARNVNIAVERVIKMVKALKSFSHFNIGTEKIEANLTEGMDTVLTIYQGQTRVGVEVVRNYDSVPPLLCFPDELNQVWTNLIHNALQAMNHAGTLTIGIRKEGDCAMVSVGDSGCGIPEEIRGKIFDVFFTTKPAGVGSGLGLDIVKKIIDKHQGRIDLQSEVGVGTTFTVTLPYSAYNRTS